MKDIDDILASHYSTSELLECKAKILDLLKEAFEAGQKMDRSKYTFADYLKTKL